MIRFKRLSLAAVIAVLTLTIACGNAPPQAPAEVTNEGPCAYEGKLSSQPGEFNDLPSGISTFSANVPSIYFTTFVAAGCCEVAGVYWLREDEILEQQFVEKSDVEDFIAYAVFALPRPIGGYQPGNYSVIPFQGASNSEIVRFTITDTEQG